MRRLSKSQYCYYQKSLFVIFNYQIFELFIQRYFVYQIEFYLCLLSNKNKKKTSEKRYFVRDTNILNIKLYFLN